MTFIPIFFIVTLALSSFTYAFADDFNTYYSPLWGLDHITINPEATEVQLLMDKSSGAGFRTKTEFGSGIFSINIKIPEQKTSGVLTSFYLTSVPDGQVPDNHFELDFEFPGTNGVVQTNVFDNDHGHREQSFKLPFDPSQDFHTYEILWNTFQIVFRIDGVPVREFKRKLWSPFPSVAMHVEASIWDASRWAGPVDWSQAPFISHFSNFTLHACEAHGSDIQNCRTGNYWNDYFYLSPEENTQMADFRSRYLSYDYCANPQTWKSECKFNNN